MPRFQVIVGNIGTVTNTDSLSEALKDYNSCVQNSKDNYGRGGNEPVTLMADDDIAKEYYPPETKENDDE